MAIDPPDSTLPGDLPPGGDVSEPEPGSTGAGGVPTFPVAPTASAGPGASRRRWVVALLVVTLVSVASVAAVLVLTGGSPTSALVGYLPDDTVGYVEFRLDAPGDQRQNGASILAHFPGFADQSNLPAKIDETLDRLTGDSSGGRLVYSRDIKPWVGGTLAVAVTRRADIADPEGNGGLVLAATRDPAAAMAWVRSVLGSGAESYTYQGVPLLRISQGGRPISVGVVGSVLLAGDVESVHAAIATGGKGRIPAAPSFQAASAAIRGDRLVFGYVDIEAAIAGLMPAPGAVPSPGAAPSPVVASAVPPWAAFTLRAEGDAVVATLAFPRMLPAPTAPAATSSLAGRLPTTTVAATEVRGFGRLLASGLDALRQSPPLGAELGPLDQILRGLGGGDAFFGWMGDTSVVVTASDGVPSFGLLIRASDVAAAEAHALQFRNLLSVAGAATGWTTREESYTGTTIVVVDLGPAADLAGSAADGQIPAGAHAEIALAARGDTVVVGAGDAFVKAVLDATPGSSLASQPAYRRAMGLAGTENLGQAYVDIRAVVSLIVSRLSADDRAAFEANVLPYLKPLEAVASAGLGGDPTQVRIVVTIGN